MAALPDSPDLDRLSSPFGSLAGDDGGEAAPDFDGDLGPSVNESILAGESWRLYLVHYAAHSEALSGITADAHAAAKTTLLYAQSTVREAAREAHETAATEATYYHTLQSIQAAVRMMAIQTRLASRTIHAVDVRAMLTDDAAAYEARAGAMEAFVVRAKQRADAAEDHAARCTGGAWRDVIIAQGVLAQRAGEEATRYTRVLLLEKDKHGATQALRLVAERAIGDAMCAEVAMRLLIKAADSIGIRVPPDAYRAPPTPAASLRLIPPPSTALFAINPGWGTEPPAPRPTRPPSPPLPPPPPAAPPARVRPPPAPLVKRKPGRPKKRVRGGYRGPGGAAATTVIQK